jgi:hypothetical protein
MRGCLRLLLPFSLFVSLLHADGPPFDLSGPKVDVHVKRGDVTLPVSEAPNLMPGDRLWIHPDLPESQATHFVLVVAFLRGSTNPPPPEWFTRVETWTRAAHDEGVFVTVPAEAQQALLFLAPETGGDFNTLRNAVRGRPGSFVRAAQDLLAASWERMRLEEYLADVKVTSQYNPAALKTRTEMAARSLGIKINESCFSKPPDQQASCLSENSEGMVLDDANAQSLVDQLASGSTLDLMNQISSTTLAGGGLYSPYVGAIVDTARILSSLHTAHFQYIPALALPRADTLNLRLNMPPSFRNPKSVVVVALPPIGPAKPEPLHPVNPDDDFCALKPGLVLPAEGAPLFFATQMAHDLVLHISAGDAKTSVPDIPLVADATRGGLIPAAPIKQLPGGALTGEVRGKWGFDDWQGPRYQLVAPQAGKWTLDPADQTALVVGRSDTLHLEGQSAVCVDQVEKQTSGDAQKLIWKTPKPGELEVTIPLKGAGPGLIKVAVYQYGLPKPDRLAMESYDAAASLERLTLSSGDATALLTGTRLDEVANARVDGIAFTPGALKHAGDSDQLLMSAARATAALSPGDSYTAHVDLKDGRTLDAPVTVDPPRPQVMLLSKGAQGSPSNPLPPIQFGSQDDLPVSGRLVFFLKSSVPAAFPRDEKVELAAADGSFHTLLTLSDGSLMLEDADTAVASLDPLTRFGSSAFGPVRIRPISADGTTGDWLPLGTLVRVPGFSELRCPRSASRPCLLEGTNLFLATTIAATSSFDGAADVLPDFTGTELIVPHPANGVLYFKLRDDPATVQTLNLPVSPLPLPPAPSALSRAVPPLPGAPTSHPASSSSTSDDTGASKPGAGAPTAPSAPPAEPSSSAPASPAAPAPSSPNPVPEPSSN